MRIFSLVGIMAFFCCTACSQDAIKIEGMEFDYAVQSEMIQIELSAPTNGWLGVGFNHKNDIVGSDLLLFRVVGGEVDALDMKVIGFGNPRIDTELGGTMDIRNIMGWEEGGYTHISFTIPMNSLDEHDYQHQLDAKFWLILAYSLEDDFEHHSRVRKHLPYTFTS